MVIRLALFLALFLYSSTLYAAQTITQPPGVIDLRSLDLNRSNAKLDGQWAFYANAFIAPDVIAEHAPIPDAYLAVPGHWNQQSDHFPRFGYGTYAVTVYLPDDLPEHIAMSGRRIKMAHRLYVNGALLSQQGEPATNKREAIEEQHPFIAELAIAQGTRKLSIVMHVSNYSYYKSGFTSGLILGASSQLYKQRNTSIFWASTIAGGLLFIGLYHLAFWCRRRIDITSLMFCCFCLGISIRMLSTGERYLLELIPWLSSKTVLSIDLWTVFFSIPILHAFTERLFPDQFCFGQRETFLKNNRIASFFHLDKSYLLLITYCVFVFLNLSVLITGIDIHSRFTPYFEVYAFLMLVHLMIVILRALLNREPNSLLFAIGFMALFVSGVNDILHEAGIVNTAFTFHIGVLVFLIAQSSLLSIRNASAFNDLEDLKNSLELRVNERTQALKVISEENRRLSKSSTDALENERLHIAREVHDNINSIVMSVRYMLGAAKENLSDTEKVKNILTTAITRLDEAYKSARQVVKNLRVEALSSLGFKTAAESLMNDLKHTHREMTVDLRVVEVDDVLSEEVKLTLYRILQESITNIIKHANATGVTLQVEPIADGDRKTVRMVVQDNGCGFNLSEKSEGVGIINMRERAGFVDCEFELFSGPKLGTKLVVIAPQMLSASNPVDL